VQAWAERRPAGPWPVYLAIGVIMILIGQGAYWVAGATPIGDFELQIVCGSMWLAVCLAYYSHIDQVARQCLARFRPALHLPAEKWTRLEEQFTTLRAGPVLGCHLLGLMMFLFIWRFDPSLLEPQRGRWLSDAALYLYSWLNFSLIFVNMVHAVYVLSLVKSLHERVESINIVACGPAFAFSTLTLHISALLILFTYVFYYVYPQSLSNPWGLGLGLITLTILCVSFFLPLMKMHRLLETARDQRLGEIRSQLEGVFARVNRTDALADSSTLYRATKQLDVLLREEEYVGKQSTWPWPAGSVAKLLTVVMLPLLLLVAQRLLERLLP
jgi:hypothetical protein